MSIVQGKLLQTKISAGSVGQYSQGLRTFVPEFQVCPSRYSFDQYGRDAPPDSIDTQTCPGAFPSSLRIDVENSLRPFVSPTYFNLPVGISGGSDTMFGHVNTGRLSAFGYQDMYDVGKVYQVPYAEGGFAGQKNVNMDTVNFAAHKYMGNALISTQPKKVKEEYRYSF